MQARNQQQYLPILQGLKQVCLNKDDILLTGYKTSYQNLNWAAKIGRAGHNADFSKKFCKLIS